MEITKSDCLTLDKAVKELGISKPTFYRYIEHLGIKSHKFAFDRKAYYLKSDVERIKQLVEEAKE